MTLGAAVLSVLLSLLSSALWALIVSGVKRLRNRETTPAPPRDPVPFAPIPGTHPGLRRRPSPGGRSGDVVLFLWLTGLCVTVLVPFLLGGTLLALLDGTGAAPGFITERMRAEGGLGYVQYWLGVAVLQTLAVALLWLRPWRGRTFGVAAGLPLLLCVLLMSWPASRGYDLFDLTLYT